MPLRETFVSESDEVTSGTVSGEYELHLRGLLSAFTIVSLCVHARSRRVADPPPVLPDSLYTVQGLLFADAPVPSAGSLLARGRRRHLAAPLGA
jgi:hypothetical protein